MLTFKILSALLVYPDQELVDSLEEMHGALAAEGALPKAERRALEALMAELRSADLMDAQARYVALFDHARSLSLHLYEHSHGESRDRGQAMVNLLNHYRANGLDPGTSELPDFLPLFLEFLSTRPAPEARALLGQAIPVVALLRARLERRGAPYAAVFRAVEALAPCRADEEAIRETVQGETRDDTPEALDRAWEEAPVTFRDDPGAGAGSGCSAVSAMVARFTPPSDPAHRSGNG
ncbi:MAG TPA: nitrate reductase molybdenum cofactor assembly chaperone [Geminicoccaceae bacterium]|nr:nitrate reductase molybdenum cofactor assembly chaperone [Geminicoccaceae bacterium]